MVLLDLSFLHVKCHLVKNQSGKKYSYYFSSAGFSNRSTNWAHETDTRSSSGKMLFPFLDTINSALIDEEMKVQPL